MVSTLKRQIIFSSYFFISEFNISQKKYTPPYVEAVCAELFNTLYLNTFYSLPTFKCKWRPNDFLLSLLLWLMPPPSHLNGMFLSVWDVRSPPPSSPSLRSPVHPTGVRGGSAVPVPAGHTHTQYAGWRTKPLVLPVKTSYASALCLSLFSRCRERKAWHHCRRLCLTGRHQFWERTSPSVT